MKVYITCENSIRGNVTGVYSNPDIAKQKTLERNDMDSLDVFELDDGIYQDQLEKYKRDLEVLVTALNAIIRRDCEWGSSKPLLDCQQCATNALKIIGKYDKG